MKNYHIFSLIEELFRFHSLSSTKDREIQTQTQSLVKFHIHFIDKTNRTFSSIPITANYISEK